MQVPSIETVVRDFVTDGVPASGKHKPKKADWRRWGKWLEGIVTAFTSNGGLIYSSLAALNADLSKPANSMAWVMGDPIAANNGVYGKVDASGAGSWIRRANLPFSFIIASDAGAGTPNAIQATTSIPVSQSALVWMNVAQTNAAGSVTVQFNGDGPIYTIKTNSGNDPVPGGLVAGMIVVGILSGEIFRLVSDQASAAIIAAAEGWANIAQAAANGNLVFPTRAAAIAATIDLSVASITLRGIASEGDGLGGQWVAENNGSTDTFTSADGRIWYRVKDVGKERIAAGAIEFSGLGPLLKMPAAADKFVWRVQEMAQDWPHLDAAKTLYGAASFYTQWCWLDEDNDLIFISRTPNLDPGGLGVLVLVRKFSTWEYVTCFIPTGFSAGWAWCNKDFDPSKRYMEGRNGTRQMARWDITTLPAPLTQIAPTATFTADQMDAYTYATYRRGEAVIGQYTEPKGGTRSFTRYSSFDKSLARTGKTYRFRTDQVGSNVSPAVDELPHMQGFCKGDGFFFSTFGGIFKTDGSTPVAPPNYLGARLFSDEPEPTTLAEGLVDPQKFLALIQAQKGITSNRIEGEGAIITKDGRCFGLFVNKWATTGMDTGGYLLIEFFAKDDSALNVSNCALSTKASVLTQPPSMWDRDGGQYRNPTTGTPWASVNEMCDFLVSSYAIDNGIDRIDVYGNYLPTAFVDLNGNARATTNSAIRNAAKVSIISLNTTTFMMVILSSSFGIESYLINGSPRAQGCFTIPTVRNHATDAAAAAAGVPVGGLYHNGGTVRVRLT